MATIQIDVDLEEFSTRELVSEITYRLKSDCIPKKDKEAIIAAVKEQSKTLELNKATTLMDQMKLELFLQKMDNISLEAIEKL